jgi:predicted RNase H-like HicB family nuclease
MKIKVIVHEAEEGGFWAEVPAIPGCATEGDTMDELLANIHEAIEGCLSPSAQGSRDRRERVVVGSRIEQRVPGNARSPRRRRTYSALGKWTYMD